MTEREKQSLKIRLGRRLSWDRRAVMEMVIEEINKTPTTFDIVTSSPDFAFCPYCGTKIQMGGDEE